MSKRPWLIWLALGLLAGVLIFWWRTDAAGAHGGKVVTLRFWTGFTGKDGETMLKIVRQFNRGHPDIHVQMQRIPWDTYYNKLIVAGLAGRAPEVFISHASMLSRFARGGFVQPVDGLLAAGGGPDVADIEPRVWQETLSHGHHLGIPLDVHPLGLYYNRTLFHQAGIVDAEGRAQPPRDWPEFVADIRRLNRDTDGDGRIDQWGFLFAGNILWAVDTFMVQHGGRILSADGQRAVIDSPQNIAALRQVQWLTTQSKLVPPPGDPTAWTAFLQGKVGMFLAGVFMLGSLEQGNVDFAAAPVPHFGPQPGVWADSHVMCMPRGLSPAKQAAAWRFITYVSDHSGEWAAGGQVPVRRSVRNSAAFRALPVQSAFATEIGYVDYLPNVPVTAEVQQRLSFALSRIAQGEISPEAGLAQAQAEVEAVLARDRATVAAIKRRAAENRETQR